MKVVEQKTTGSFGISRKDATMAEGAEVVLLDIGTHLLENLQHATQEKGHDVVCFFTSVVFVSFVVIFAVAVASVVVVVVVVVVVAVAFVSFVFDIVVFAVGVLVFVVLIIDFVDAVIVDSVVVFKDVKIFLLFSNFKILYIISVLQPNFYIPFFVFV